MTTPPEPPATAEVVDVALPVPLAQVFTYRLPRGASSSTLVPRPGSLAVCPFRGKRLLGVVLSARPARAEDKGLKLRSLDRVLEAPSLPSDLFEFLLEVARYYLAPVGEVMRLALPPAERATEELLEQPTLFSQAAGVAPRIISFAIPAPYSETQETRVRLGKVQASVLARIRATAGVSIAELTKSAPSARQACEKLAELGLVTLEQRERPADPFFASPAERDTPPELTVDQASAVAALHEELQRVAARRLPTAPAASAPAPAASAPAPAASAPAPAESKVTPGPGGSTVLLRGITGSGKTEVYLRAIAEARRLGLGVIVLVPEIALTPQLLSRFRARFGDDVAVLHSALTPKERLTMWKRLRAGEVDVAIGARSALFAPIQRLGLIIVDEEHDPSFKQEEGVRYQARDMAILRAHRAGGVALLGSATPSLEAIHLVRSGRARLCELTQRARAQSLPQVEIVDLRRIGPGPTGDKRLSLPLHRAIEATLQRKEQIILFLNRRGFSPSARCESCGALAECPNCAVALTYHKGHGGTLRCHYCDYQIEMWKACTACGSADLALEGIGTERLEETLQQAFPEARVARLDRDVGSGKAGHKILERVARGEVDILVGTQMVAKGHDLPRVTLVGVINADAALSIPDFRAAERGFHLLVQVAGRAGRGDLGGRVIVQTYDPKHVAIASAARHDVTGFTDAELMARQELSYPPFSRLALLRVDGLDEAKTAREAARLAALARGLTGVEVMGPAPAPITRVRNRFRYRVLLRAASRADLRRAALAVLHGVSSLPTGVGAVLDVDPSSFL
jgi:primosomal protein N' (replication factor Y)